MYLQIENLENYLTKRKELTFISTFPDEWMF